MVSIRQRFGQHVEIAAVARQSMRAHHGGRRRIAEFDEGEAVKIRPKQIRNIGLPCHAGEALNDVVAAECRQIDRV